MAFAVSILPANFVRAVPFSGVCKVLEYIADFPVWYLVNTEHGNIMGGTRKKGERFVPIFSDEDLAERFVAPKPEATALFNPVSVAESEFGDFLDTIEGEG